MPDIFACPFKRRLLAIAVASPLIGLLGCGEREAKETEAKETEAKETIEQYAKHPIGCESKSALWYAEKVKTNPGQEELRKQIRSYKIRAEYHGRQTEFISLSAAEKSEQVVKTIQCYREVTWATETLQKAGLAID